MSLIIRIEEDYKNALREKDSIKREILNFVLGQIKNKQIDLRRDIHDDEVSQLLKKEMKGRKETIVFLKKAGKDKDIIIEKKKMDILLKYLPKLFSEEKLKDIVHEYKKRFGIYDMKLQKGKLIGLIMKDYGAQIDGSLLNFIISSGS